MTNIEVRIHEMLSATNITGCCRKLQSKKFTDCLQYLRDTYQCVNENNFSELLYWYVNDIKEYPKCPICGKNTKFQNFNIGYRKYCCYKCSANSQEVRNKYKQTCIEKYGVTNVFSDSNIKEKIKNTCIEKYGDITSARNKDVRDKYRKTCIEKYGDDNVSKISIFKNKKIQTSLKNNGVMYPLQNDSILLKAHNTCIDRYGIDNPMKCLKIKKHFNDVFFNKYGFLWPGQVDEFFNKMKRTNLSRYGNEFYIATEEGKEKSKQTNILKYGTEFYSQSEEWKNRIPILSRKMSKRYNYKNILFDSSPELALFIYLSDSNISFTYHPEIVFYYFYNNKKYCYFPDFKVENELWEIKGDHFFNKFGELIDPYDASNNERCKFKYECMLINNVKILKTSEYSFYTNYINDKYGKNYLKQFKQY